MAFLNESLALVRAAMTFHVLLLCAIVYVVGLSIYRLFFSPVAGFPGPKLAAVTQWYEFYWNVIKPGKFVFHLQDLHDQYGPIVRINPWELHVRDPDFYEVLLDGHGERRDKLLAHVSWTDTPTAGQATVDHDLHKIRRTAQNPFFSKRQIQGFTPYIQSCADKLCRRLANEYKGLDTPVTMSSAYGCLSGDVMMQYCFAKNHDFLDFPEFRSPFLEAINNLEKGIHVLVQMPWLLPLAKSFPESILPTQVQLVFGFKKEMRNQIQDIMADRNQGYKDASHPTVFKKLLDSDLPPQEKTIDRLQDEGIVLVGAGQETVKAALTIATFYILKNPAVLKKLRDEILTIFPDPANPPDLAKIEQLPYFTACLQEAIRLVYGLSSRVARVAFAPIQYGTYTIPAGTPVSSDHYGIHHNETLFPDSHTFVPERWLDNPKAPALDTLASSADGSIEGGSRLLSRYLVSFSKGSRTCVGMHLAYAQLYIVLANVFRRCDLELFQTEYNDVGFVHDFFVPTPALTSKGLRVIVKDAV